jgi:hypothetical protein
MIIEPSKAQNQIAKKECMNAQWCMNVQWNQIKTTRTRIEGNKLKQIKHMALNKAGDKPSNPQR